MARPALVRPRRVVRPAGGGRGRLAPWLAVALGAGVLLYFGLPAEPPEAAIWLAPPLLALALWTAARWPLAGWALGLVAAAALGFADGVLAGRPAAADAGAAARRHHPRSPHRRGRIAA